ncbi:hypothetical protein EKG37_18885 [Robertmurraya yapensis]|uniref:Metallo-beta-lactamase domain-containing protein n=2 Tax=Bacillaceae TaxID=186817 RepID=A0A431VWH4_9BACI|nr:hypothetical protein [Bacillus yapensis]RTR27588.1 hypothetical protein EKG37_18885 [Bacillus yapensis]TKS94156.1 hypothetical protein FAR12_18895 [Bacillus yapensis]
MNYHICATCGVQYEGSTESPEQCTICNEERQYVNPNGQSWTTLGEMSKNGYKNNLNLEETGLYSLKTTPDFGIGQTAYIVQSEGFNMMWDCITYIDEATIKRIEDLGGLQAIALSHPHYYSTQVEWAEIFNAPIYIHEDDKEWVTRRSDKIIFWSGESLELDKGKVIHRLGGHFKGGSVLEWKDGNEQKGILLSGDIIQVVADREWVSFMYSYPNLIPLPVSKVQEIAKRVNELKFDRLYNAFHRIVKEDAKNAVQKSAARYIAALNGTLFNT